MTTPRFIPPSSQPRVRVSKVEGRQFARLHDAYRYYREKGLSKIESLDTCRQFHADLNKAFCIGQENGEAWTREPLDAKTYTPEQLRGKLN